MLFGKCAKCLSYMVLRSFLREVWYLCRRCGTVAAALFAELPQERRRRRTRYWERATSKEVAVSMRA